jgi:hypothetical protein
MGVGRAILGFLKSFVSSPSHQPATSLNMPSPQGTSFRGSAAILGCALLLAGCGAVGPLPSSYSGPVTGSIVTASLKTSAPQQVEASETALGEIRSTTCPGLALERDERRRRISALKVTIANELTGAPTTLIHALKRVGGKPEEGTIAFKELSIEQGQLDEIRVAAERMSCPVEAQAAAP